MLVNHPARPQALTLTRTTDRDRVLTRWSLGTDPAAERTHHTDVDVVCRTADPEVFAAATEDVGDNRVRIALHRWDTLEPVRELARVDGYPSVKALAASPDGRWLALASLIGVHLVAADTGQSTLLTGVEATDVVFTPDGGRLLAGWGSQSLGGVYAWDPAAPDVAAGAESLYRDDDDDGDVRLTVDGAGTQVAIFNGSGWTTLYDEERQAEFDELEPAALLVCDLDGRSAHRPRWSVEVGNDVFTPTPGTRITDVPPLVFSATGGVVMAGTADGHVLVFAGGDGDLLARVPTGSTRAVTGLARDVDGQVWAFAGEQPVPIGRPSAG